MSHLRLAIVILQLDVGRHSLNYASDNVEQATSRMATVKSEVVLRSVLRYMKKNSKCCSDIFGVDSSMISNAIRQHPS